MERWIFICGCGHSGTSLLANMFASHPDVFIPLRETEIFLTPETAESNFEMLRQEAQASGRRYGAEKTPRHVHAIPLIRRIVPGARFVVMVRDGRDVAASFIKRYDDAGQGRKRWVRDNLAALPLLHDPDIFLQRYEDLILDPEGALRRICAFAGIGFDPEMLRYHETSRLWFGVEDSRPGDGRNGQGHKRLRNWQINQPIFDGRGAWKRVLPEAELAEFDAGPAHDLLDRFGYLGEATET